MKYALILVLLLTACAKDPVALHSSSNPEVPVSTLFEHEGCTVYRFEDGGNRHYFARCGEQVQTMTTITKTCGRNCWTHRPETIPTQETPNDNG